MYFQVQAGGKYTSIKKIHFPLGCVFTSGRQSSNSQYLVMRNEEQNDVVQYIRHGILLQTLLLYTCYMYCNLHHRSTAIILLGLKTVHLHVVYVPSGAMQQGGVPSRVQQTFDEVTILAIDGWTDSYVPLFSSGSRISFVLLRLLLGCYFKMAV